MPASAPFHVPHRGVTDAPSGRRLPLLLPALRDQLGQSRDVGGNPPALVRREHLRLPRLGLVLAAVEIRDRLPVGVADDIAAGDLLSASGGGKAA
jgi:hypothetical protein